MHYSDYSDYRGPLTFNNQPVVYGVMITASAAPSKPPVDWTKIGAYRPDLDERKRK